jgi:hypothetical protein
MSGPLRGKGRSVSKADLKRSQLPVTDKKLYVCEPIPAAQFPDMLPVLDPLGGFLFWADEQLARALLKKDQVRIFRTPTKIRALQAKGPLDEVPPNKVCSQNRYFGLPHHRETDTNPARVWTQDRMGSTSARPDRMMPVDDKRARWCRKVCIAVVNSCTKKAA